MSQPPRKPVDTAKLKPKHVATSPFHPRNRHQGRYDFVSLVACCPALTNALIKTPTGDTSIDFSRPQSVRLLNRALLQSQYGIADWDLPEGYLCPPIPGRADYLHALADLLASGNTGVIPSGNGIRVLDIGVGASCIYPLVGHREYGWRFVGTDIDAAALTSAAAIVNNNPSLVGAIELRRQSSAARIFAGTLRAEDRFDLSLCNPPFNASAAAATAGSERKWRQLGKSTPTRNANHLNFGGQAHELWCRGGERSFLRQMIAESVAAKSQVLWFSSLVSKAEHLPALRQQLQSVAAFEVRVVAMSQGNKQSRLIAWTFHDAEQQFNWRQRWK